MCAGWTHPQSEGGCEACPVQDHPWRQVETGESNPSKSRDLLGQVLSQAHLVCLGCAQERPLAPDGLPAVGGEGWAQLELHPGEHPAPSCTN